MKTKREVFEIIKNLGELYPNIRAAYLEGSRVNKNIKPDNFQDYDIGLIVENTKKFIENDNIIKDFGEILYMQYPDLSPFFPSDITKSFGRLVQFADGTRVDITVKLKDVAFETMDMYEVIFDKDNIFKEKIQNSDFMFVTKKPTQEEFDATTNEFWWCLNNVGKSLVRKEYLLVFENMDIYMRKMITRLMCYYAASKNDYKISLGKSGKLLKDYLDNNEYMELLKTYERDIENLDSWIRYTCEFFQKYAQKCADSTGLIYNLQEGERSFQFYRDVVTGKFEK